MLFDAAQGGFSLKKKPRGDRGFGEQKL